MPPAATLPATMFVPVASSTAAPAAPRPLPGAGRRQPRARHLPGLRRDPLREPAQRGRHRAGVGRPGAAVPAQHRAAQGLVDLPAGFMELGESTADGARRETDEEAGARIELQELFTMLNVVRAGQVHLFYRARMLDTHLDPGPETIEARCSTSRGALGRDRVSHGAADAGALLRGSPQRQFRRACRRHRLRQRRLTVGCGCALRRPSPQPSPARGRGGKAGRVE
jgi:ADP-ribose pyrophosphatase YjhB (NUDIX family)